MYRVGAFHERKLLDLFRAAGFEGVRAAGSSCPDLVVARNSKTAVLECKYTSGDFIFLKRDNIARLLSFSEASGCEAYAALKYGRNDWLLLSAKSLADASNGTGHTVHQDWAESNGTKLAILLENWGQSR